MVVVWSADAVKSEWVQSEADRARGLARAVDKLGADLTRGPLRLTEPSRPSVQPSSAATCSVALSRPRNWKLDDVAAWVETLVTLSSG